MRVALNNPAYKLELIKYTAQAGGGTAPERLVAWLPGEISLSFASHYEPVFANLLKGGILGAASDMSSAVFGYSLNVKQFTQQIWIGTEPVDLQFQLLFDARESATKDVHANITKLARWLSPSRDGYILKSPAPTMADTETNRMAIRVGRILYIPSVVLTGVSNVIPILPEKGSGKPIAASVDIQLKSAYTPDAEDLAAWFGSSGTPGDGSLETVGNDFIDDASVRSGALGQISAGARGNYPGL